MATLSLKELEELGMITPPADRAGGSAQQPVQDKPSTADQFDSDVSNAFGPILELISQFTSGGNEQPVQPPAQTTQTSTPQQSKQVTQANATGVGGVPSQSGGVDLSGIAELLSGGNKPGFIEQASGAIGVLGDVLDLVRSPGNVFDAQITGLLKGAGGLGTLFTQGDRKERMAQSQQIVNQVQDITGTRGMSISETIAAARDIGLDSSQLEQLITAFNDVGTPPVALTQKEAVAAEGTRSESARREAITRGEDRKNQQGIQMTQQVKKGLGKIPGMKDFAGSIPDVPMAPGTVTAYSKAIIDYQSKLPKFERAKNIALSASTGTRQDKIAARIEIAGMGLDPDKFGENPDLEATRQATLAYRQATMSIAQANYGMRRDMFEFNKDFKSAAIEQKKLELVEDASIFIEELNTRKKTTADERQIEQFNAQFEDFGMGDRIINDPVGPYFLPSFLTEKRTSDEFKLVAPPVSGTTVSPPTTQDLVSPQTLKSPEELAAELKVLESIKTDLSTGVTDIPIEDLGDTIKELEERITDINQQLGVE